MDKIFSRRCLTIVNHSHVVYQCLQLGAEAGASSDHKIFIIQQKCNNTENIFVSEYIVVGDALTIGCAAEMIFMNIVSKNMQKIEII